MMKRLLAILLSLPLLASAASVNTYTLYPTNYAVSGDTITANGVARTFTNSTTATTILTNRTSFAGLITNVFNAYGAYSIGANISYGSSTSLVFRGLNLTLETASGATNWAVIVTNLAPSTNFYAVHVPDYNMPGTNTDAVKVNTANYLARYIDVHVTTNAFREAATVVSNLVGRTSTQDVGNKRITNSTLQDSAITNATRINGTVHALTNGQYITPTLRTPTMSNGVNYGTPFRSPGGGTASEQFGTSALASTNGGTALGNNASAGGEYTTAIGSTSGAGGFSDTAIGSAAAATGGSGVALGAAAEVGETNGVAIGTGAFSGHADAGVLGRGVESTDTNQWTIGRSDGSALLPGRVQVGSLTNATFRGTNNWNGDMALTARANTSLANGNNAGVLLGTNVYLRISGPSASYTLAGFAAERGGSYHILQLANPAGTITVGNESGLDATAANRILTGTGADLSMTNNPSFLQVLYDDASSRWRVITHSR